MLIPFFRRAAIAAITLSVVGLTARLAAQIGPPQIVAEPSAPVDQRDTLVNAPVAPAAIYIAMAGPMAGVAVVDLDGFGQGTGDLTTSNFLANPNLGAPGVFPPLAVGSSALDAGGAGPLTLTADSAGSTRLAGPTELVTATDIHIGQPLDLVFNNSNININASSSNQVNPADGLVTPGNTISIAPHPNPPRLVFPPPNPTRFIATEEPTVATSNGPYPTLATGTPPCTPSAANLLVPPLGTRFPGVFTGPQPSPPSPPPPPAPCRFASRQQIGHFLYVLDPASQSVVVLNSNRFTVLARLGVRGADAMAMAPNLQRLAVASSVTGFVQFVDTDPLSPTFHRIVARTFVGGGNQALAWQPEGEDLLVTRRQAGELVVIRGSDLAVRRTIRAPELTDPVDVVATARQVRLGFSTGTWFAYVLNGDGSVALFESGPDPIGADGVIATLPARFLGATTLQPDVTSFDSAVWIAHRAAASTEGRLSRLALTAGPRGPQPVQGRPPLRGRVWTVTDEIGGLGAGAPRDLAFDDAVNVGAWPDARSPLVPGLVYARHSGKGHVKIVGGSPTIATAPQLVVVARGDGDVQVHDLRSGAVLARRSGLGAVAVAHYWRQ